MNALKMNIVKNEPIEVREMRADWAKRCAFGLWKCLIGMARKYQEYVWFALLLMLWFLMPLLKPDGALVTDGLWQLVLMALICFLGILGLCWWLLGRFWILMGLPDPGSMVLRFKQMKSCYQIGFYLGCFALLLLVATGCLMAIV